MLAVGDQAGLQAEMQADALLDTGDLDGAATWRKIKQAGGDLPQPA